MDERNFQMDEVAVPSPTDESVRYAPNRQEALQKYDINIQFLSRGCIVRVGCKVIAFENAGEALLELNEYYADPYATQEKWRKELNN